MAAAGKKIAIGIAAVLFWSAPSYAAAAADDDHPSLPCRPTVTCTADIVRPGSIEIEVGYLFQKLTVPTLEHSVPILVKLTLAEWVQLQVGGNGPTFTNAPLRARYLDNLVAGLKFHLLDESKHVPSFSWSASAGIPLAAAPGYLRAYDLFLTAYATKNFAWLHADLNLGLDLWQVEAHTRPQPWISLALSVGLPRHFSVTAESYYFFAAAPVAARDGGLRAAVAFSPRPWIVFDVGGDVGYFQSQRSFSVFGGMTVIPVVLWRARAHRSAP